MKKLALFGMTLALALPLVAARAAEAAEQPKIVAQAAGEKDPYTLCWTDDANGTGINDKVAAAVHDIFANMQYLFYDNSQLVLAKVSDGKLQAAMPVAWAVDVSDGKGYYVVHLRKNGVSLDGTIYRFSSQPDQWYARLTWIIPDAKGNVVSTYIEQNLTFAGTQPSPAPQPNTGGGN
jgi:hypothetical protein